jgi:hypothetical protein
VHESSAGSATKICGGRWPVSGHGPHRALYLERRRRPRSSTGCTAGPSTQPARCRAPDRASRSRSPRSSSRTGRSGTWAATAERSSAGTGRPLRAGAGREDRGVAVLPPAPRPRGGPAALRRSRGRSGQPRQRPAEAGVEVCAEPGEVSVGRGRQSTHHDQAARRERRHARRHQRPQATLHPVADDGVPHGLRYNKTDRRRVAACARGRDVDDHGRFSCAHTAAHRPAEVAGTAHAMRRGKHRAQAESSERPLRRRAARIARPARVRMRSRKPWVFARRRLFGWKVRLVTRYSKTRWGSASSVDTRNATSDVVHDVPGRIWGHAEATELAVKRYVVRLPQVKPAGGQPAGRVGAALRPGAAEVLVHRIVHRCGRAASTCGSSSAPARPGQAGSGSSTG